MIGRAARGRGWVGATTVAGLLAVAVAGCARTVRPGTPAQWRAALQPPLDQATSATLAQGVEFGRAIELALARNPALEAERRRWLAAIHALPQAATPMDPSVKDLSYDFEMNRWDSVGIEMPLPWWGKLRLGGRIAGAGADLARVRYEIAARDLIIDVKDVCYELFYLDQAIPIVRRTAELLRTQGVLAYGGVGQGTAALNEAFRAEYLAAQLDYDRRWLEARREVEAERLRALLNLPPGAPLGPASQAPVYAVDADPTRLQALAERWSQVLQIRGLEVERAAYETQLAHLARVPDPMLMLRAGNLAGPGGTAYMGMATANLPLYEWRNRALARQQEAMEAAMRAMALDEVNRLRAAVARAWFEAYFAERLDELYRETLLPQAEAVVQQAERDYRAGLASLSNVIETTLAWQNFMLTALRARADWGRALGRLERLVGTVARAQAAPPAPSPAPERAP